MANYGVGPSGYVLSSDGDKAIWASGAGGSAGSGGDLTVNNLTATSGTITNLVVTDGAELPAFSVLAVTSAVASGAGGNASVAPIPGAVSGIVASGWISISVNGAAAYIPIWV